MPLVPPAATGLGEVVRRRYLLRMLVRNTIQSRYQGTVLGWLWSYLQPAIRFCLFYFLFQVMVGRGGSMENFAVHLFAGMVIVHFFTETFNGGTQSLIQNRDPDHQAARAPGDVPGLPDAGGGVAHGADDPDPGLRLRPARLATRPGGDGRGPAGLLAHRAPGAGAGAGVQRGQRLHARLRQGGPDPHPVRHVQRADDVPVHPRPGPLRRADRDVLPLQPDGGGRAADPARLLDRHDQRPGVHRGPAPARPPLHARADHDASSRWCAWCSPSGCSRGSSRGSRSASDDHHDPGGARHQVVHHVLPPLAQADRARQGARAQDPRRLQRRRRRQLHRPGGRVGGPDGPQRLRQVDAAQARQRGDAPRLGLGADPRAGSPA